MNAELFGFTFATAAPDPFGMQVGVQSAEGDPMEKPAGRRRAARSTSAVPRFTAAATAQLTATGLLELVEPTHGRSDLVVSPANVRVLTEVVQEVRQADDLRRHGLKPRSKLLFCGPPGCGKTLCAEVLAAELKLPLVVARLDAIITTYLGETASNLRKVFEAASALPVVLFLDEFDALARARTDSNEHSEIRRVVNSLLMMIDRYEGRGILVAATNLAETIDEAAWRRFDEVLLFDRPNARQVASTLKIKLRNYPIKIDPLKYVEQLKGFSYAEIERVCLTAIKRSILDHHGTVNDNIFQRAIDSERRRAAVRKGASVT